MAPETKPPELRAWRAFLNAQASLLRQLEAELVAAEGMTLAEFDVLIQLRLAPDVRLRMTELSDRVRLSPSGLTRLIDRLIQAGLVERGTCPSDRRGTFAILTPAGRERLRRARPVHLKGIHEHFGKRLSTSQLTAVADALEPLARDTLRPVHNRKTGGDDQLRSN